MMNNQVKRAIDSGLSCMCVTDRNVRSIMNNVKEGRKVKKKLPAALVLTLVLVLAAVTALAALTLNAYYEKVMGKEGESGLIEDWSADDKVALVDWMMEAGIGVDAEKAARLHSGGLPEKEKAALAMEIIEGYYPARDGILTVVDIMAKDKGPIEYWSQEDKVWFSQMMEKYQPDEGSGGYRMPEAGDITQEQAIEIMYAYYKKEYGLDREDFDESKMTIGFSEGTWDDGSGPERLRTWGLDLWLKDDPEPMGISILPDGTIKQATGPYVRTWRDDWYDTFMGDDYWTVEGMYAFKQEWGPKVKQLQESGEKVPDADLHFMLSKNFALPGDQDIPPEEARKKAEAAALGFADWMKDKLEYYLVREAYLIRDDGKSVYFFWYLPSAKVRKLTDQERDALHPVVMLLDAKTGDVIRMIATPEGGSFQDLL